jgi:hypothetical protein
MIAVAAWGRGPTPMEAAEDARRRFEAESESRAAPTDLPPPIRGHASIGQDAKNLRLAIHAMRGVSRVVGPAVETDQAMPVEAVKSGGQVDAARRPPERIVSSRVAALDADELV